MKNNSIINCCRHNKNHKKCQRSSDKKIFKLPRKYTRDQCKSQKGFSMKASCAPYKGCSKIFDVYIDQNPKNTISIKYKTIKDVKNTIKKLKKLYKQKKYSFKRIKQVAMILMVRLRVLKEKKLKHYKLAKNFYNKLKKN